MNPFEKSSLIVVFKKNEKTKKIFPLFVEIGNTPNDLENYTFRNPMMMGKKGIDTIRTACTTGELFPPNDYFQLHCLDFTGKNSDFLTMVVNSDKLIKYAKNNGTSFYETCVAFSKMLFSSSYDIVSTTELTPGNVFYELKPKKLNGTSISEDAIIDQLGKDFYSDEVEYEKYYSKNQNVGFNGEIEEEEFSGPVDFHDANIPQIIKEISSKIVLQDEAIRTIVTNVYYNQMLFEQLEKKYYIDPSELESRKVNIMLEGSTGTGKTAIITAVANKFNIPCVIRSAASFSETGYVGASITDMLRALIAQAGGDLKKAQKGIIGLDEVDKIARKSGLDMKKGVQDECLALIGGAVFDIPVDEHRAFGEVIHFDTSKITFILGGAWTNIRDSKLEEYLKQFKQLGFTDKPVELPETMDYRITPQDYINEGLSREFFGRIKLQTGTKTYTKEDYRTILLSSSISALKTIEKTVKMFGYKGITYDEGFIDEVCSQAYDMDTGARALQAVMFGVQNRILLPLITGEFDRSKPVDLTTMLIEEYNSSLLRTTKVPQRVQKK